MTLRRRFSTTLLVASVATLSPFAAPVLARSGSSEPSPRASTTTGTSFRDRMGVERAEKLRASTLLDDRLRGLERLGTIGSARAVEELVHAVQPGGGASTPEERLVAVRELAKYTDQIDVRRALASVFTGHAAPSGPETASPLDRLAQSTAAVALARAGAPDALQALGRALASGSESSSFARDALLGYPPRDIAPLLAVTRSPSDAVAKTLGELGDQRAFDVLRSFVRTGSSAARAEAAVALTRLGDFETVDVARAWLARGESDAVRVAATRILCLAHAPDAPAALVRLLDADSTWIAALDLAVDAPDPSLLPALAKRLETADDASVARILAAVGRAGGHDAASLLERELGTAERGPLAANALARMAGADARDALSRALGRPETRRAAARAATLRWLVRKEDVDGFRTALDALARSSDAADRAAALAGRAALDPDRLERSLASRDEAEVRSVASLLLLAPADVAAAGAARIADSADASTRTALALSLAVPGAAPHVPTRALVALVDSAGPAAPLAAFALGARDEPESRPSLGELLSSTDPVLRAHVALGLGASSAPDSAGLLSGAFRFETNGAVRAAILRALSERPEHADPHTVELGLLDPDPRVLAVARIVAAGGRVAAIGRGAAAALVVIADSSPENGPAGATAELATEDGLALPFVAPPDGVIIAGGFSPGGIELRVAPRRPGDKDPARGRVGNEKSGGG